MENNSASPPSKSDIASSYPWWHWRSIQSNLQRRRNARVIPEHHVPQSSAAARAEFVSLFRALLKDRQSERRAAIVKRLLIFAVALMPFIYIFGQGRQMFVDSREGKLTPVVKVVGTIGMGTCSADTLLPVIRKAFKSASPTVAFYIDSPGGRPGEAERIAEVIRFLKSTTSKRVDVVFGNTGASAAYLIGLAGDTLYAPRYSLIGSVGAVIQSTDLSQAGRNFGASTRTYASGQLKAPGDLLTSPTSEQNSYVQSLIDTMGQTFVQHVLDVRGAKLRVTAQELATGRVWVGTDAKSLGLVDQLGTLEQYLAEKGAQPRWYEPSVNSPFGGLLTSLVEPVQLNEWLDTLVRERTVLHVRF